MSGQWRPEWDDPEDGHSDAGLPELPPGAEYSDLELSEVTSFLASVSGPALPSAFEARISAAIAAEAAARAADASADVTAVAAAEAGRASADSGADDAKETVRSDNSKEFSPLAAASHSATSASRRPRRGAHASAGGADSSGPGHSRPGARRRRLRMPSLQAASWVLVGCLFLGGFGFLITRSSGSSSSSSEAAGSASAPYSASSAAGSAGLGSMSEGSSGSSQHQNSAATEPSAAASASGPGPLDYVESGTRYEQSTLARQVREVLAKMSADKSTGTAVPAASSSASSASTPLIQERQARSALQECVSQFSVTPTLVDRAYFDGKPAYIIVTGNRVWVVGPGCSGADKDVITSVPLPG